MSEDTRVKTGTATEAETADRLSPLLLDIVRDIPKAHVRRSAHAEADARRLARRAAGKAALAAGALALPSGPLGWLTLLPELRSVWRIQVQLVADIAALYGRKSQLTQEQVLYCLFGHDSGVQRALRDLLVQVGGRGLAVQPATARALKFAARKVAVRVAQRLLGQGAARWLPVAGAVGMGAYAWHETSRVATTAIAFFAAEGVPAPRLQAGDADDAAAEPAAPASNAPRLPRPGGA